MRPGRRRPRWKRRETSKIVTQPTKLADEALIYSHAPLPGATFAIRPLAVIRPQIISFVIARRPPEIT